MLKKKKESKVAIANIFDLATPQIMNIFMEDHIILVKHPIFLFWILKTQFWFQNLALVGTNLNSPIKTFACQKLDLYHWL